MLKVSNIVPYILKKRGNLVLVLQMQLWSVQHFFLKLYAERKFCALTTLLVFGNVTCKTFGCSNYKRYIPNIEMLLAATLRIFHP